MKSEFGPLIMLEARSGPWGCIGHWQESTLVQSWTRFLLSAGQYEALVCWCANLRVCVKERWFDGLSSVSKVRESLHSPFVPCARLSRFLANSGSSSTRGRVSSSSRCGSAEELSSF